MFIEVNLIHGGKRIVNTDSIVEVTPIDGGKVCILNRRDSDNFKITETYEQIRELLCAYKARAQN